MRLPVALALLIGFSLSVAESFPLDSLIFDRDFTAGSRDPQGRFMGGTEMVWLVGHKGRLYAGNGYWNDSVPGDSGPGPQVLRKDSSAGPWIVDRSWGQRYLRLDGLASITFVTDAQGHLLLRPDTMLLASPYDTTQPASATVWSRDDRTGEWIEMVLRDSLTSPGGYTGAGARTFFSHIDRITGVQRVFAGLERGLLYGGVYDSSVPGRIRWDTIPELANNHSGRIHHGAEVGGNLYATMNPRPGVARSGGLYRRCDGPSPSWELVYEWEHGEDHNYELRGLTATAGPHGDSVLLGLLVMPGRIIRIEPRRGDSAFVELDIRDYLRAQWGFVWPPDSVELYGAYNEMVPVTDSATGTTELLIGLMVWHPRFPTPPYNGAWYLVRSADGTYRPGLCADTTGANRDSSRLYAVRTICVSPFADDVEGVLYFGGFDAGGQYRYHNTAWIYRAETQPAAAIVHPSSGPPDLTFSIKRNIVAEQLHLSYQLPKTTTVAIEVSDVVGRTVSSCVLGVQRTGRHELDYPVRELPAGAYVVRLATGLGGATCRRILILR